MTEKLEIVDGSAYLGDGICAAFIHEGYYLELVAPIDLDIDYYAKHLYLDKEAYAKLLELVRRAGPAEWKIEHIDSWHCDRCVECWEAADE